VAAGVPDLRRADPTAGGVLVRSIVPRGNGTTHDTGEPGTIDTGSLAVGSGGKTLFWTSAGAPRSAPLE
jgi:hypothetical protein